MNKTKAEFSIIEQIHKIDYLQPFDSEDSMFVVEKTFTLLDWLILERAVGKSWFDLSNVDEIQQLQLASTILPNGRGILHMLASNTSNEDYDESWIYFHARDLFNATGQKM